MNLEDSFMDAASELDQLSLSGFFGTESRILVEQRSCKTEAENLYDSCEAIIRETWQGKQMKQNVVLLLQLITSAIKIDAQQTVDILSASMKGTESNPELETLSTYARYVRTNQGLKNTIEANRRFRGGLTPDNVRIQISEETLSVFVQGFEYDMKIFAFVLALLQLANQKKVDLLANEDLSASRKLNRFRELDVLKEYEYLTNDWDDKLRNAISHGDIRFNLDRNSFVGKNSYKVKVNGKLKKYFESLEVTPAQLFTVKLPKIYIFAQSYILSLLLLYLAKMAPELYRQSIQDLLNEQL